MFIYQRVNPLLFAENSWPPELHRGSVVPNPSARNAGRQWWSCNLQSVEGSSQPTNQSGWNLRCHQPWLENPIYKGWLMGKKTINEKTWTTVFFFFGHFGIRTPLDHLSTVDLVAWATLLISQSIGFMIPFPACHCDCILGVLGNREKMEDNLQIIYTYQLIIYIYTYYSWLNPLYVGYAHIPPFLRVLR